MLSSNGGDFRFGVSQMLCGALGGAGSQCSTQGIPDASAAGTIRAKKANMSGKDGAKDIPSWAKGSGPEGAENGKQYAARMMNEKYGNGNWETSSREYSQLKKYGDRAFVPPEGAEAAPAEGELPIGPIE
jgi:hypothetical protein